jgi:hypothetical protein
VFLPVNVFEFIIIVSVSEFGRASMPSRDKAERIKIILDFNF